MAQNLLNLLSSVAAHKANPTAPPQQPAYGAPPPPPPSHVYHQQPVHSAPSYGQPPPYYQQPQPPPQNPVYQQHPAYSQPPVQPQQYQPPPQYQQPAYAQHPGYAAPPPQQQPQQYQQPHGASMMPPQQQPQQYQQPPGASMMPPHASAYPSSAPPPAPRFGGGQLLRDGGACTQAGMEPITWAKNELSRLVSLGYLPGFDSNPVAPELVAQIYAANVQSAVTMINDFEHRMATQGATVKSASALLCSFCRTLRTKLNLSRPDLMARGPPPSRYPGAPYHAPPTPSQSAPPLATPTFAAGGTPALPAETPPPSAPALPLVPAPTAPSVAIPEYFVGQFEVAPRAVARAMRDTSPKRPSNASNVRVFANLSSRYRWCTIPGLVDSLASIFDFPGALSPSMLQQLTAIVNELGDARTRGPSSFGRCVVAPTPKRGDDASTLIVSLILGMACWAVQKNLASAEAGTVPALVFCVCDSTSEMAMAERLLKLATATVTSIAVVSAPLNAPIPPYQPAPSYPFGASCIVVVCTGQTLPGYLATCKPWLPAGVVLNCGPSTPFGSCNLPVEVEDLPDVHPTSLASTQWMGGLAAAWNFIAQTPGSPGGKSRPPRVVLTRHSQSPLFLWRLAPFLSGDLYPTETVGSSTTGLSVQDCLAPYKKLLSEGIPHAADPDAVVVTGVDAAGETMPIVEEVVSFALCRASLTMFISDAHVTAAMAEQSEATIEKFRDHIWCPVCSACVADKAAFETHTETLKHRLLALNPDVSPRPPSLLSTAQPAIASCHVFVANLARKAAVINREYLVSLATAHDLQAIRMLPNRAALLRFRNADQAAAFLASLEKKTDGSEDKIIAFACYRRQTLRFDAKKPRLDTTNTIVVA